MAISFVNGFENLYSISEDGAVFSYYSNFELKQFMRNGYKAVCLVSDKKKKFKNIHRMLAEAFIENPLNKSQINHIDGNKTNNSLDNLEWATPSENITHAHKTGLIPKLVHTQEYKEFMSILMKESKSMPVICVETGIKYPSAKTAGIELGIVHSSICRACRGERKTAGGKRFNYL